MVIQSLQQSDSVSRSTPSECEERRVVMAIRGSKRVDVSLSNFTRRSDVPGSPTEASLSQAYGKEIGSQACMPTIAIRERMMSNETMMKAQRDLIG